MPTAEAARRARPGRRPVGGLPAGRRGAARRRGARRARLPRRAAGARRLRRRRRLLRASPGSSSPGCSSPSSTAPAPSRGCGSSAGASAGCSRRRCSSSSSPPASRGSSCRGGACSRSGTTSSRRPPTSSTGSSRRARSTTSASEARPSPVRALLVRSPSRGSSTSCGRSCCSPWRWSPGGSGAGPDRRTIAVVLGVLTAASFGWSLWASHTSPAASFFTTTTRVWELGTGALLAVWLTGRERPRTPSPAAVALGWAGLALLLVVAVRLPTGIEWPSGWALLPTLPTALVLWAGWRGGANGPVRLLGTPAAGLGRRPLVLDLPLALAGARPRRLDRRAVHRRAAAGVGPGRAGRGLGVAGLGVVAVRRGPAAPRHLPPASPAGPARLRPRAVGGRGARSPPAPPAAQPLRRPGRPTVRCLR